MFPVNYPIPGTLYNQRPVILPKHNCTCLVWHGEERCCRKLINFNDLHSVQEEMYKKTTKPFFSRSIPKLMQYLMKEWGLTNASQACAVKISWDAVALLDKTISVVTAEIYDVAQVNEKQAAEMIRQLESHFIPRLASALRICIKRDSSIILVPAAKCVESLRRLGHPITEAQFNRSEQLVLRRMNYRLEWYSVFHCTELLVERLHNETSYCTNPKILWSYTEPVIEVYMIHRAELLKEVQKRRIPIEIDSFVESAAVIMLSSYTAEPPVNVRDIMNVLSLFINRETKYVAMFCDLIIFYLLK